MLFTPFIIKENEQKAGKETFTHRIVREYEKRRKTTRKKRLLKNNTGRCGK
jgi:hypothetical protein